MAHLGRPAIPALALVCLLAAASAAARAARAPACTGGISARRPAPRRRLRLRAGGTSRSLYSGWVALGLAAAGHNPLDVSPAAQPRSAIIRGGAGRGRHRLDGANDPRRPRGRAVRRRALAGEICVATAASSEIRADGSVSGQVNLTAFAVLALRSAGVGAGPAHALLADPPAGPRRRLQLCHRGRRQRRR